MSDTANPANLASAPLSGAKEFDARLRRTDENRWLATRYGLPAVGYYLCVAGTVTLVALLLLGRPAKTRSGR